ncbi:hypothetical protein IPM19_02355 [bacterium]|nr:MAG: hypothetical protein IPM19_02355 [bacterium]
MALTTEKRIKQLMMKGQEETKHLSNPNVILQSEYHQKVKEFGQEAIKSLFQLLKDNEGCSIAIFGLLSEIHGRGPIIPLDKRGNITFIRKRWLRLGKVHELY